MNPQPTIPRDVFGYIRVVGRRGLEPRTRRLL